MNLFFQIFYGVTFLGSLLLLFFTVYLYNNEKIKSDQFYSALCMSLAGALLFGFAFIDPLCSYPARIMRVWTAVFWTVGAFSLAISFPRVVDNANDESVRGQFRWAGWHLAVVILIFVASPFVATQSFLSKMPSAQFFESKPVHASPKNHDFEKFNISVTLPTGPWVEFNAKPWSKDSLIAFFRSNPTVYFQIIAEEGVPLKADFDEVFAKFVYQAMMKPHDNKIIGEKNMEIAGIQGHRFDSELRVKGSPLMRVFHWMGGKNGYYYQFRVWAAKDVPLENLEKEFQELTSGVSQIDKDRKSRSNTVREDFNSPRYHYAVHGKAKGWDSWWVDLDEAAELADYKLSKNMNVVLRVYPFVFEEGAPELSLVTKALLRINDIDYGRIPQQNMKPITEKDLKGFLISYKHTIDDNDFDFKIKILRGEKIVYYVTTFRAADFGDGNTADLDEGVTMFEALKTGKLPDPKSFTPEERKRHARVTSWVGDAYTQANERKKALSSYKRAHELDPEDMLNLEKVLQAYWSLELYEEGFLYAEKYERSFEKFMPLKRDLALLADKTKRWKKAQQVFEEVIKQADPSDKVIQEYLNMMKKAGKEKDAQSRVNELIGGGEGDMEKRIAMANALEKEGKTEESRKIMKDLYEKQPHNDNFRIGYYFQTLKLGHYAEMVALVDSRKSVQEPDGNDLFYKGYALAGLKRYSDSRKAFEQALKLVPDSPLSKTFATVLTAIEDQQKGTIPTPELDVKREIQLNGNAMFVHEKIVFSGESATAMRRALQDMDQEEIKKEIGSMLDDFQKDSKIDVLRVPDLKGASKDLSVDLEYKIPDAVEVIGSKSLLRLPRAWELRYSWPDAENDDESPLFLVKPMQVRSSTTFIHAPGIEIEVGSQEKSGGTDTNCIKSDTHVEKLSDRLKILNTYILSGGVYEKEERDVCSECVNTATRTGLLISSK